jgi:transcriptional regulator with XRE-family HTH domain
MTELHERVRAMRKGLGLTQEQLAERAGLERTVIVKIETDRNQASSHAVRSGLAAGFGLSLEDADAVLDGRISVKAALAIAQKAA